MIPRMRPVIRMFMRQDLPRGRGRRHAGSVRSPQFRVMIGNEPGLLAWLRFPQWPPSHRRRHLRQHIPHDPARVRAREFRFRLQYQSMRDDFHRHPL